MAFSGPSREELENYFKNSRQYFDELAKYYLQSDKEYYDKFIAPFYNNPFRMAGSSTTSSSGGGAKITVIIAIMLVVMAFGIALFFLVSEVENDSEDTSDGKTEEVSKKVVTAPDTTGIDESDYYEEAMNYYYDKDYENAEKYFKRVPRKDKNYPDAIRKLKAIEQMKLDKKDSTDDRRMRAQPKQRYN